MHFIIIWKYGMNEKNAPDIGKINAAGWCNFTLLSIFLVPFYLLTRAKITRRWAIFFIWLPGFICNWLFNWHLI